ncbi:MAG: RNA 2',3'-cyclic phosphodiesterase [Dehalococcoidia bacterium]|nr:RNA 2',3'-cyclic phosphodiesterase [Dehalococcoidia bacterium]
MRAALVDTAAALRRAGAGEAVRWVRPEGVHITLKFLGATDEARVPALRSALAGALAGVRALGLRPEGVGSFGGRRSLRVIWVGVRGDTPALSALAARVEAGLSPLGFASEQRPFDAHLTLGRVRDGTPASERERLAAIVERFTPSPLPPFRADAVSLMQSTPGRGGASYRARAVFALQ